MGAAFLACDPGHPMSVAQRFGSLIMKFVSMRVHHLRELASARAHGVALGMCTAQWCFDELDSGAWEHHDTGGAPTPMLYPAPVPQPPPVGQVELCRMIRPTFGVAMQSRVDSNARSAKLTS
jgi:hypothetical protein